MKMFLNVRTALACVVFVAGIFGGDRRMRAAAAGDVVKDFDFIIVAPEKHRTPLKELASKELAETLARPHKVGAVKQKFVLFSDKQTTIKGIENELTGDGGHAKVIIAVGPAAPAVADVTRKITTKGETLPHLFAVILFEPLLTEGGVPVGAAESTEAVAAATPHKLVDIDYNAIDTRLYNFYTPAPHTFKHVMPMNAGAPLAFSANGVPLPLKGINIACYGVDEQGGTHTFNFFKSGAFLEGMSTEFAPAKDAIRNAIEGTNKNYALNTDFGCLLVSTATGESATKYVPSLPFMYIRRFTRFAGNKLLYESHPSPYKDMFHAIWDSAPFGDSYKNTVEKQLKDEGTFNVERVVKYPYLREALEAGKPLNWSEIFAVLGSDPHVKDGIAHVSTQADLPDEEKNYVAERKKGVRTALAGAFSKDDYFGERVSKDKSLISAFSDLKLKTSFPDLAIDNNNNMRIPTIALVTSGGGIRAMLAMFGFLKGLERAGLLDAVTYVSALSGSTWALGSFVSDYNKRLAENTNAQPATIDVLNTVSNRVAGNLKGMGIPTFIHDWATAAVGESVQSILVKGVFGQPVTLMDYYGAMIAQHVLGINPKDEKLVPPTLSTQLDHLKEKAPVPFPLYASVVEDPRYSEQGKAHYAFYEFTPFQVGHTDIGCGAVEGGDQQACTKSAAFIPTWALGRKFAYGTSQDKASEQSLGMLMATFGSAFAASLSEIAKAVGKGGVVDSLITKLPIGIQRGRITYPSFFNPEYALLGAGEGTIKNEFLTLVDAGLHFNLPFQPVSGHRSDRKADIIIFLDASADDGEAPIIRVDRDSARGEDVAATIGKDEVQSQVTGKALRLVAEWAKENNSAFPVTSAVTAKEAVACIKDSDGKVVRTLPELGYHLTTVLKDAKNPESPLVIYMPLARNLPLIQNSDNKHKNRIWAIKKMALADNGLATDVPLHQAINLSDYPTSKFDVDAKDAALLMALMEFNVLVKKDVLWQQIGEWIKEHNKK